MHTYLFWLITTPSFSSYPAAPPQPTQVRPDGDVELEDAGQRFMVPPCDTCGGVLKPDGEGEPRRNRVANNGRCLFLLIHGVGNRGRQITLTDVGSGSWPRLETSCVPLRGSADGRVAEWEHADRNGRGGAASGVNEGLWTP